MPRAALPPNGPPIYSPYDPEVAPSHARMTKKTIPLPKGPLIICELCEKVVRPRDGARHSATHLSDQQQDYIYCPYFPCTTRVLASRPDSLDGHIRATHTKPLTCPECKKVGTHWPHAWTANMCHHYAKHHPGVPRPKWPRAAFPKVLPTIEQVKEQHRLRQQEDGVIEALLAPQPDNRPSENSAPSAGFSKPHTSPDAAYDDRNSENEASDHEMVDTIRISTLPLVSNSSPENFIDHTSLTRVLPLPTQLRDRPSSFPDWSNRHSRPPSASGSSWTGDEFPRSNRSDLGPTPPSSPGSAYSGFNPASSYPDTDYDEWSVQGGSFEGDENISPSSEHRFQLPHRAPSTTPSISEGMSDLAEDDLPPGCRIIRRNYRPSESHAPSASTLPPRFQKSLGAFFDAIAPPSSSKKSFEPPEKPATRRLPSPEVVSFRHGLFVVKGRQKTDKEWLAEVAEARRGRNQDVEEVMFVSDQPSSSNVATNVEPSRRGRVKIGKARGRARKSEEKRGLVWKFIYEPGGTA